MRFLSSHNFQLRNRVWNLKPFSLSYMKSKDFRPECMISVALISDIAHVQENQIVQCPSLTISTF